MNQMFKLTSVNISDVRWQGENVGTKPRLPLRLIQGHHGSDKEVQMLRAESLAGHEHVCGRFVSAARPPQPLSMNLEQCS